jgi:hypothetical protein
VSRIPSQKAARAAAHGSPAGDAEIVQTLERREVDVRPTGESGRPRKAFEVFIGERRAALGGGEGLESVLPCLVRVGVPPARELRARALA